MTPLYLLIIVFPEFDPLTASGMALYCKISQNVKIYLAYTESKRNGILRTPSISGIDFSLY
jgi:hypothetical protein